MVLTFGGLGVWTLIDFIRIVTGNFKDGSGLVIKSGGKLASQATGSSSTTPAKSKSLLIWVALGSILFLVLVIVVVVAIPGEDEAGTPKEARPVATLIKPVIDDNLSAERHVEIGMSLSTVTNLIKQDRKPPWITLNLKLWQSEAWRMKLDLANGDNLLLTPMGADIDSPYFAWIFFPTISGASPPTFVFFDNTDDSVFHIQRFGCDDTLKTLAFGGQHTGVPQRSACHP